VGAPGGTGNVYLLSLTNSRPDICRFYAFLDIDLSGDFGYDCSVGGTTSLQDVDTELPAHHFRVKHTTTIGALDTPQEVRLSNGDGFGEALAILGDVNLDSVIELAVGSPFFNNSGAVYLFSLPNRASDPVVIGELGGGGTGSPQGQGVPAWIAGPILGAMAGAVVLFARKKKRDRNFKELMPIMEGKMLDDEDQLPVELLSACEHWPIDSLFSKDHLESLISMDACRINTLEQELHEKCLEVPVDDIMSMIANECDSAIPDPSLLEAELQMASTWAFLTPEDMTKMVLRDTRTKTRRDSEEGRGLVREMTTYTMATAMLEVDLPKRETSKLIRKRKKSSWALADSNNAILEEV